MDKHSSNWVEVGQCKFAMARVDDRADDRADDHVTIFLPFFGIKTMILAPCIRWWRHPRTLTPPPKPPPSALRFCAASTTWRKCCISPIWKSIRVATMKTRKPLNIKGFWSDLFDERECDFWTDTRLVHGAVFVKVATGCFGRHSTVGGYCMKSTHSIHGHA